MKPSKHCVEQTVGRRRVGARATTPGGARGSASSAPAESSQKVRHSSMQVMA